LLNSAVNKHVSKDSALVLIDDNATTRTFMEKNDYKFKTLLSNLSDNPADHKPQIEGSLHLQHVNAMHRLIRRFLKPYCGVSSKYLQNYVAMYIWLRGVNSNRAKQLEKVSVSRAAFSDCYITAKEINSYPRVPVCA